MSGKQMDSWEVTRTWIMENGNRCNGQTGWTRDQLKVIGVRWPPVSGWIERAIGMKIGLAEKTRFEAKLNAAQVRVEATNRPGAANGL